jgi:hypothetical protein
VTEIRGQGPAPVVPAPAAAAGRLRGRRVIVGVPGHGWRTDLRADDSVVHGSRTFVPVLTEQDYYRAEMEHIEVFAPLVPIERVWVEQIAGRADRLTANTDPATLDAPPRREPCPAAVADTLLGRRVVQAVADGHVRDLRAVTEVYRNPDGIGCIRVCGEADWYRWGLGGSVPSTVEITADLLWAE